jgi:hypothetical protein
MNKQEAQEFEVFGSVGNTDDGGFILGGWTNTSGNPDFWLVKTDAVGKSNVPPVEYE